jgi:hypothetical protein
MFLRLCRYQSGYLEQGTTIEGAQVSELQSLLNGLPRGLSRASHQLPKDMCRTPGTLGSVDQPTAPDSESYQLDALYRVGREITVTGRLGYCGNLGVTDGVRTGQRTERLAETFTQLAGNSWGYPDDVVQAG